MASIFNLTAFPNHYYAAINSFLYLWPHMQVNLKHTTAWSSIAVSKDVVDFRFRHRLGTIQDKTPCTLSSEAQECFPRLLAFNINLFNACHMTHTFLYLFLFSSKYHSPSNIKYIYLNIIFHHPWIVGNLFFSTSTYSLYVLGACWPSI